MLFSDRHIALKGGVAVALLLALVLWGGLHVDEAHPSIEDCLREPERFRGREVYVGAAVVAAVRDGEVAIEVLREKEIVRCLEPPSELKEGDRVSVLGTFLPPHTIRARIGTVHPGYVLKRVLMYLFSAGALIWLLAVLARRYRISPGIPMFHPRR